MLLSFKPGSYRVYTHYACAKDHKGACEDKTASHSAQKYCFYISP